MVSLSTVIWYSLAGGVFSLAGGLAIVANKQFAKRLSIYASPFAAGVMLSAAFLDLLAEAVNLDGGELALLGALVGMVTFFLMEKFLFWFHHHHAHRDEDPRALLVVVGDLLHNFLDGIAIGIAFTVDFQAGILTTLAVAAHEIPQEIGDFGLMLKYGYSRLKTLLINVISSLFTVAGAVAVFSRQGGIEEFKPLLLGAVAGFFIYVAASDIIPDIHKKERKKLAGPQTVMFVLGIALISYLASL